MILTGLLGTADSRLGAGLVLSRSPGIPPVRTAPLGRITGRPVVVKTRGQ